jgi:benzoylformate decarboxylase
VDLAEVLGAPVWGTPFAGVNPFPTVHPLWRGYLPPLNAAQIRAVLGGFRRVLHVGPRPFPVVHYDPAEPMLPDTELLQVVAAAEELGRHRPIRAGTAGDMALTVRALADGLRGRRGSSAFAADSPMRPAEAAAVITSVLPMDTLLVDEAWCISKHLRSDYRTSRSGRYFWGEGTGLGWGMPTAVGLALASGERVICAVGDGSAMYCPQALWSAAEQQAPVTFVVVDNNSYLVVESQIAARIPGRQSYAGTDLRRPAIDFAGLASSMGVEAYTANSAADLERSLSKAVETDRPNLIHALVSKSE